MADKSARKCPFCAKTWDTNKVVLQTTLANYPYVLRVCYCDGEVELIKVRTDAKSVLCYDFKKPVKVIDQLSRY